MTTPAKHLSDSLKKAISTRIKPDTKVVLGLSGGPDSVALLYLLLAIGLKPILAHVNYHLRGKDSNLDQKFVEKLAQKYQLKLQTLEVKVKKLPGNLEENCRQIRYDFFEKTRRAHRATYILTAHHLNDQIETFLFNLTRGASLRGFMGMPEFDQQRHLLRPLLNFPKTDLLQYLQQNKLAFRQDKTNQNLQFSRNLIRHKVIPVLSKINSNFLQTAGNSLKNLQENLIQLENSHTSWLENNFQKNSFSLDTFLKLSPIKQKSVISLIYKKLNQRSVTAQTVKEILATLRKNRTGLRKEFGKSPTHHHWLLIKKDPKTAKRLVEIKAVLP